MNLQTSFPSVLVLLFKKHFPTFPFSSLQLLSLLVALVFVFSSCEKEVEPTLTTSDLEEQEIRTYLQANDYNLDSVEFKGDYVVYERDAAWEKAALLRAIRGENPFDLEEDPDAADMMGLAVERQRGILDDNMLDAITAGNVASISYFIRPSIQSDLGNDWVNAINTATANWNAITNCRIVLTRTFTQGGADIVFGSDIDSGMPNQNLPSGVVGRGTFPSNGVPGRFITINASNNFFFWKVTTIMHELGHNLGFRHTGSNDGQHIHTTPQTESNSVMNPSVTSASSTFRSGDLRMARMYYPDFYNAPTILSVSESSPGTARISYMNPNYNNRPYYWIRVAKYNTAGNILAVRFFKASTNGNLNNIALHTVDWGGHGSGTYLFAIRGCNFRQDVWSPRSAQLSVTF